MGIKASEMKKEREAGLDPKFVHDLCIALKDSADRAQSSLSDVMSTAVVNFGPNASKYPHVVNMEMTAEEMLIAICAHYESLLTYHKQRGA